VTCPEGSACSRGGADGLAQCSPVAAHGKETFRLLFVVACLVPVVSCLPCLLRCLLGPSCRRMKRSYVNRGCQCLLGKPAGEFEGDDSAMLEVEVEPEPRPDGDEGEAQEAQHTTRPGQARGGGAGGQQGECFDIFRADTAVGAPAETAHVAKVPAQPQESGGRDRVGAGLPAPPAEEDDDTDRSTGGGGAAACPDFIGYARCIARRKGAVGQDDDSVSTASSRTEGSAASSLADLDLDSLSELFHRPIEMWG